MGVCIDFVFSYNKWTTTLVSFMNQTKNKTVDYLFVPAPEIRKQLKRDPSPEGVLKVVKQVFPDLTEDVLDAVVKLDVALNLPRVYTGISRSFQWNATRNKESEGFSPEAREEWAAAFLKMFDNLENSSLDLKALNFIAHTNRVPGGVLFNWSFASKLSNFALWKSAEKGANVFDAPDVKPTTTSRDFSLVVRPVVVNPENPEQVWASGEPLQLPENFASLNTKQKNQVWNELLENNREKLMEQFGFDQVPTAFHHPQLRLRWNMVAPDQSTQAYQDRTVGADWTRSTAGNAWLNKISAAIDQSYVKAGEWFALQHLTQSVGLGQDSEIANQLKDYVSDLEWDYMNFPRPQNEQQFLDIVSALKKTNSAKFDVVTSSVFESVFNGLDSTNSSLDFQRYESLLLLPQIREWFAQLPWNDNQKNLEAFIEKERQFVQKVVAPDLKNLSKKVPKGQFNDVIEILLWNDVDLPASLREELFPQPNEVLEAQQAPADKILKKTYTSSTDWSDLTAAFETDFKPVVKTTLEYTVNPDNSLKKISGNSVPFANWMERLSPPTQVEEKTHLWLLDNEAFNALNRIILREKDGDEAALNAQLAEKLKNVMEVSTKILQENQKNNGWIGRLRNNFREGVTSDNWADAFADFRNHMLMMYGRINKQMERDRLWLKYADNLMSQAGELDGIWSSWLMNGAEELETLRENNPDATSEQKMQWNERVEVLKSAALAHDHIKGANAVTGILLEKVRQSVQVKERLQNRSMMFYWQNLSLFAGLQSLQRNANGLFEQAEMVDAMKQSLDSMTTRSVAEEQKEKERIRQAFKDMAASQENVEQFYKQIAAYQSDTVGILAEFKGIRVETQKEAIETLSMSGNEIQKKRQRKAKVATVEQPTKSSVSGP